MNPAYFAGFLIVWVAVGLATGLWMARRGHSAGWTIIAVVLGPLFVPIAYERVERTPRAVSASPSISRSRDLAEAGPHVVVGYDGSAESRHALLTAQRLFGTAGGTLALATVVSFDDGSDSMSSTVTEAERHLATAVAGAEHTAASYAVLAGPAGPTLRWFAANQEADVLIIGKRGHGLSTRFLGSVAEYLIEHCSVPVLIVDPDRPAAPTEPATSPVTVQIRPSPPTGQ